MIISKEVFAFCIILLKRFMFDHVPIPQDLLHPLDGKPHRGQSCQRDFQDFFESEGL